MADTKVSLLTSASALGGTEVLPGVQSAASVKITANQLKTWANTSPVITTGCTASGSASNDFSASTGTFKTSTGANTLSGAVTVNDATTPSITLASGKTNTGFFQVNGKTSGGLKLIAADAAAQTVTVSLAAQTTGAATLTIPDQAGTNRNIVTDTGTQTLTNKSLSGSSNTFTNLPASGISGVIPIANLATGTPNGSKFVRDDGTLATPAGSGTVTNTGGNLTANSVVLGAGTTDTKVVAGITTDGVGSLTLSGTLSAGSGASTAGAVSLTQGTTQSTGTTNITLQAPTSVTSWIATLPGTVGTNGAFWTQSTSSTTATISNSKVVPSGAVLGDTDTQTITNKRVTARITTITSSATPTVNTDNCDCVTITALAAAITSMTTNLTGTPVNFDQLEYRIKDDGTARAITWGASFVAGPTALPTTTTTSKALHVYFEYDSVQTKWVCMSSGSDA